MLLVFSKTICNRPACNTIEDFVWASVDGMVLFAGQDYDRNVSSGNPLNETTA